ncbi:MAG: hypothetical protein HC926_04535 [Synechococcaceae cyanobacterium SM2_3_60]|nr:hypothetical protein [Synechococcaceae cyanobacterium SM2_3_60]
MGAELQPNGLTVAEKCLVISRIHYNSDIYALGRVAIEMLVGSLPETDLRTQHLIPLSHREPELSHVIERMIQPDADQRYTDVAEVQASLARYAAHRGSLQAS